MGDVFAVKLGEELTGGEDLPCRRVDGTRTGEDLAWRREMGNSE